MLSRLGSTVCCLLNLHGPRKHAACSQAGLMLFAAHEAEEPICTFIGTSRWLASTGEQLPHRRPTVHNANRPPNRGDVLTPRIDAERLAEGAEQIGHGHGPVGD